MPIRAHDLLKVVSLLLIWLFFGLEAAAVKPHVSALLVAGPALVFLWERFSPSRLRFLIAISFFTLPADGWACAEWLARWAHSGSEHASMQTGPLLLGCLLGCGLFLVIFFTAMRPLAADAKARQLILLGLGVSAIVGAWVG